jgi:hypothetical protein
MYFSFLSILLISSFVNSIPTSIPINNDIAQIKQGILSIEKSIQTLLDLTSSQGTLQVTPKDNPQVTKDTPQNTSTKGSEGEIASRYPNGNSCDAGGTYSTNEFGANICEYPDTNCPITKYFSYPGGGNGVELCCKSNSDCNYNPIKNYCLPGSNRCTDGSYFGCSLKAGPIFDSCK